MIEYILSWNYARSHLDKSKKKLKSKENILKKHKEIKMLIIYRIKNMEV